MASIKETVLGYVSTIRAATRGNEVRDSIAGALDTLANDYSDAKTTLDLASEIYSKATNEAAAEVKGMRAAVEAATKISALANRFGEEFNIDSGVIAEAVTVPVTDGQSGEATVKATIETDSIPDPDDNEGLQTIDAKTLKFVFGIPVGQTGLDGNDCYAHIKFSAQPRATKNKPKPWESWTTSMITDEPQSYEDGDKATSRWIGFKFDTNEVAPTNPTAYTWFYTKGEIGDGYKESELSLNRETWWRQQLQAQRQQMVLLWNRDMNGGLYYTDDTKTTRESTTASLGERTVVEDDGRYKGYDALYIEFRYANAVSANATRSAGWEKKNTVTSGSQKGKKYWTYANGTEASNPIQGRTVRAVGFIPAGQPYNVTMYNDRGEFASRQVQYTPDTGEIKFYPAVSGGVYNGGTPYNYYVPGDWNWKTTAKIKSADRKKNTPETVTYRTSLKTKISSNNFMIPWRIWGVKGIVSLANVLDESSGGKIITREADTTAPDGYTYSSGYSDGGKVGEPSDSLYAIRTDLTALIARVTELENKE